MGVNRRSFLIGSTAVLAAPSIVRASSLMPVSVPKLIRIDREALYVPVGLRRWRGDPVAFVQEFLGFQVQDWQANMLRQVSSVDSVFLSADQAQ